MSYHPCLQIRSSLGRVKWLVKVHSQFVAEGGLELRHFPLHPFVDRQEVQSAPPDSPPVLIMRSEDLVLTSISLFEKCEATHKKPKFLWDSSHLSAESLWNFSHMEYAMGELTYCGPLMFPLVSEFTAVLDLRSYEILCLIEAQLNEPSVASLTLQVTLGTGNVETHKNQGII